MDFEPVFLVPDDIGGAASLCTDVILAEDATGGEQQRVARAGLFVGRDILGDDELALASHEAADVHDRCAFGGLVVACIERIEAEAKTAGGIIIPDTAQEKPQQGKVSAVGPGGRDESGKLIPIDVKVGDRILFGKWSGTEVKIDGVEYLIMKESDIMGVLVEAETKKKAA